MSIIITLLIFNIVILIFAIKTKKFLYTITPEKQWEDEINMFNRNIKSIEKLENTPNFKLGNGHLYL